MKKKMPLRVLCLFLSVALVPVLIFSGIMQFYTVRMEKEDMQTRIDGNLNTSNQGLDMVFEKYTAILYDLCTNNEILNMVKCIDAAEDDRKENINMLRYRLGDICNRYDGIEGIIISLADGKTIFYDGLNSSSVSSTWIEQMGIPEVEKGDVYRGISEPVIDNDKEVFMFQIARNLSGYGAGSKKQAVAAISINEEQICGVLNSDKGRRQSYLLEGDIVMSASSKADIGRDYADLMDLKSNRYTCFSNKTNGFTICNIQPIKSYKRLINIQYLILGIIVLFSVIVVLIMVYVLGKPYLKVVDDCVEAMNRVENGDFSVPSWEGKRIFPEMLRIEKGFQDMIICIESRIRQEKQESQEQQRAAATILEAQIAPHFLYNALDMINWKAIENEQYDISEMLGALGDILRYSVKNIDGMTTLRTEFNWLENYIRLGNAEMSRKTKLKLKVPEELMELKIHKLLLQPFIENALKYAFLKKGGDDVLMVGAGLAGGQIHITIEDNGRGIDARLLRKLNDETADMGDHVGIANVRKRLKLYYGEEAVVYFESIPDKFTRIHLFIPLRTEMQVNG